MRYVLAELRWRQGAARRAFHTSSLNSIRSTQHNVRVVGEQRRAAAFAAFLPSLFGASCPAPRPDLHPKVSVKLRPHRKKWTEKVP